MFPLWNVLWTVLLLVTGTQVTITPSKSETTLPAASIVCTSTADQVSFESVQKGLCPLKTQKAPADVWFRVTIPPTPEDILLFTSDLFTIKQGQLSLSVNHAPPVSVRASDPLSQRPFVDGRLSIPVAKSPTESTEFLIKIRIRDQRQLAHPERHVFVQEKTAAIHNQLTRWVLQGAFLGLVLIMAVYHLFLWRAERLAAAAWYSAALCALGLYFSINRNLLPLLPWGLAPKLALLLHPPIATVVGLCFLQFIRKYAHLPPRGEQLVKLSVRTLLVWTPIALLIDAAGNAALAATSVNFLSVICMTLTMGSLLVGAYRGDRESLVLAISSGPSVIGISFLIGAMSGILPPGGLVDASMQIGVTTQVSLLGLALSDRIRRLRIDRDQAQAILRLTLPDVIADRLKAGEKYIADRHSRVAVLFADLAGFTPLSATHEPETIVQLLDALFREMDALARKVGAEKIKTIGDCYMVVAGAPSPHADPVAALADLALAIPEATERVMKQVSHLSYDLPERLSVRIGLHVGPVVAGVLGEQKLAYDLWGDTVNTASRMESHGVVGRVQCSQQVVEALSDRYEFEPRGDITIRGKGTLPVWLLVGKRAKPQDS